MIETAEDTRTRVLAGFPSLGEDWKYDLAMDLGYQPESWDGMWKLTPDPFRYRNGYVIVREVIQDEEHRGTLDSSGVYLTRLKARLLPPGWRVIDDMKLTSFEHHYVFVSPRRGAIGLAWIDDRAV
jgi:hypothetical protein